MVCSGGEGLPGPTTLSHLSWDSSHPTQAQTRNSSALAAPCPPFPVTAPQCAHLLPQHREPRQGQASRPPHLGPTMDTIIPLHPTHSHPTTKLPQTRTFWGSPTSSPPHRPAKGHGSQLLTPQKHAELLHGVRLQPREASAFTAFGKSKGIRVQI